MCTVSVDEEVCLIQTEVMMRVLRLQRLISSFFLRDSNSSEDTCLNADLNSTRSGAVSRSVIG